MRPGGGAVVGDGRCCCYGSHDGGRHLSRPRVPGLYAVGWADSVCTGEGRYDTGWRVDSPGTGASDGEKLNNRSSSAAVPRVRARSVARRRNSTRSACQRPAVLPRARRSINVSAENRGGARGPL